MGYVAFYKLKMEFDNPMRFDGKIEAGLYPKPVSAAIVDQALDYFLKVKQDLQEH